MSEPDHTTGTVKVRVSGPSRAVVCIVTALKFGLAQDEDGTLAGLGVTLSDYTERCTSKSTRTDITAWEITVRAAPVTQERAAFGLGPIQWEPRDD